MRSDDVQKYLLMMSEIKRRTAVIDAFSDKRANALYDIPTTESIYLQFRKILELIALSSLVANKEKYSQAYEKFEKHWNAKKIVLDVERINPNFYPEPVIQVPSSKSGVKMEFLQRERDYLTKDELVKLYEKCAALMHAQNPYRSKPDYTRYENEIPVWQERIDNLLYAHVINLVDSTDIHLIQMGTVDAPPSHTPFGLLKIQKREGST